MYAKKKFLTAPLAALTLMFVASGAQAELCANKLGQVFSRAQCKAKETVVPGTPGPIGPIGPPGPQGPVGAQGPSGVNTSPCTIDSIAGVYSFESVGNNPFYMEGCSLIIQPDGTFGGASSCSGARINGAFGPIPMAGKVNLEFGPTCVYRFEYTYLNGEKWMYRVQLNSTRSNILGSTLSSSGFAGTVVGTRWYPTGSATASSAISNGYSEEMDALTSQQQKWLSEALSSMNNSK